MNLIQIKYAIRRLSVSQLRKLDEWLHELIKSAGDADHIERSLTKKQSDREKNPDGKTYRLEGIRCGKEGCKCNDGKLHGPYFYAYWSERGVTKSQYIGKKL